MQAESVAIARDGVRVANVECPPRRQWRLSALVVVLWLSACGGGGGGGSNPPAPPPPPPPPPAMTEVQAARFLSQASFGPTHAEIARLRTLGYAAWIDQQLDPAQYPPTLVQPYLQSNLDKGLAEDDLGFQQRRNTWLWQAATAGDQLRMRMAFALSEIMVVSDQESKRANVMRIADYQDTLSRNAFGSYRSLLKAVTLHPAMGVYLSYAGNRKASTDGSIVPDENYGREVMQLFSIGLLERNADFSPKQDAQGNSIPTYDEKVISAMARVFTGWTYAGLSDAQYSRRLERTWEPMECHPAFHDSAPKQIFRGIVIAAGNDCRASLEQVLDALSTHPNTAPFISRQLIQRFVTSNPSPAYIARVTAVWTSTGGNLGQVLRAILLDSEARNAPAASDPVYGKPREPLLRLPALWRSFEARYVPPADGSIRFRVSGTQDLSLTLAQDSQRSPSVFNFFEPDHRLSTADGQPGIYAPELQIVNEATFSSAHNQHEALLWSYTSNGTPPTENTRAPVLDLSRLIAMAARNDHVAMLDEVNLLMFEGRLGAASKTTLQSMLDNLRADGRDASERARSLLLVALASPNYAVQR